MTERTVDLVIRARDNASQAFDSLNSALGKLEGVQEKVAQGADLMKAALGGTEQDLRKLTAALEKGGALRAADGFRQIGDAVTRMGDKLAQQRRQVDESREAYRALVGQANSARDALSRMNEAIGPRSREEADRISQIERSIRDLDKAAGRAEKTWDRHAAEVGETETAYNRLEAAAGVAETTLRKLQTRQEAVARIQQGRDAGGGFSAFAARAAEIEDAAARARASQAALNREIAEADGPARRLFAAMRQGVAAYRRASVGADQLARSSRRAGNGIRFMQDEVIGARRVLAAFYGDSRRALSLMQRLRGEVLSLTAAFVGFYGVFEQGAAVVRSFQELEAATNRLEAATGGNVAQASRELGNLRSEADRLGISFETLATNYSSFLISGQQAGLETDQVREIFTSVTEAGRVLGLNNERLGRTFTALTQIAGKGTVQMEELRQQLGDNLPGAVGILAKELGYAEDELDDFYKAVENGAVGAEEGLLALARGLDNTFGDQLDASLESVNAQIGRLQNNIFNRRITAGNAGFIDGLETLLDGLNDFLSSDEGVDLFERLGAAAGRLLAIIPGIFENLDKIGIAIKALVAFKFVQLLRGWAAGLAAAGGGLVQTRAAVLGFNTALAATSPAAARALAGTSRFSQGLRGLVGAAAAATTAVRGLLLSLGGPVGIALTALSFAAVSGFADIVTEVDVTNRALTQHERIIDKVRGAYNGAQKAGTDWMERLRNDVQGLSEAEVRGALADARQAAREIVQGIDQAFATEVGTFDFNRIEFDGFEIDLSIENAAALEALVGEFDPATGDVREFGDALAEIGKRVNTPLFDKFAAQLVETAREAQDADRRVEQLEAVLAVLTGTASDAERALVEGTVAVEGFGDEAATQAGSLNTFSAAINTMTGALGKLSDMVPSLRESLKLGEDVAAVEAAYQNAISAAASLPSGERDAAMAEALRLRDQAVAELTMAYESRQDFSPEIARRAGTQRGATDRELVQAVAEIAERNNWSAEDILTFFSFETGGTLDPWQAGPTTKWGQHRGLIQWGEPQREQYGVTAESTIRQQVMAVERYLRDRGARPGMSGMNLYAAVNAGNPYATGASDTAAGGTPGSVADKWNEQMGGHRARARGLLEVYGSITEEVSRTVQADQERAEAQSDFLSGLDAEIEQQRFATSLENARMIDREVALAIREAEQEAAEVGLDLTAAQRNEIEAVTRARLRSAQAAEDEQAAQDRRSKQESQAADLEAEVSRLRDRKAFLIEEIAYAESQGDTARAEEMRAELEDVNGALEDATEKAIAFWEALGGEGSQAAIQALKQAQAEMKRTEKTVVVSGEQMNEMIANKLTGAMTRFSERVANGEDAWTAFKEEFLRAVAEMLIEIGALILKQAILNALTGGQGGGGGAGGAVAGLVNGLFHTGGIAGQTTQTRTVNPAVFADAIRYHSGGIAGLRPNEVAAVLEEGEEVLTENDPRHRANGGGGSAPTVINAFDAPGFLDAALASAAGGDAILNFVRANKETVKASLEQ